MKKKKFNDLALEDKGRYQREMKEYKEKANDEYVDY